MEENLIINFLENELFLLSLDNLQYNDLENSLSHNISEVKKKSLLNSLAISNGFTFSFGKLISLSMLHNQITESEISQKTKIPIQIIEDLKNDRIFINSIPIISCSKLIKYLKIPFEQAKEIIINSFDLILQNSIQENSKSYVYGRTNNSKPLHINQNFNSLFQNKEAIEKYLDKLKEIED